MTGVRAHWKWIMVTIFNQVKTIPVTNRQRWWVSVMNGNSWRMTNERDGGTHNSVTCDMSCHHNMDTETLCTPLNTAQTRLFDLNQQMEKCSFILSRYVILVIQILYLLAGKIYFLSFYDEMIIK